VARALVRALDAWRITECIMMRWCYHSLMRTTVDLDSHLLEPAFVRIVTNPEIWDEATSTEDALEFIERLRRRSCARLLTHGPGRWHVFARLCKDARARGKLVADAYHAALAIEHGCQLVTADADFARFAGLRYRHPLA
jgi:toxin-antitoxin system PIN domain toxin